MAIKNHHKEIVGVLQCMNKRIGTFDHEVRYLHPFFPRSLLRLGGKSLRTLGSMSGSACFVCGIPHALSRFRGRTVSNLACARCSRPPFHCFLVVTINRAGREAAGGVQRAGGRGH